MNQAEPPIPLRPATAGPLLPWLALPLVLGALTASAGRIPPWWFWCAGAPLGLAAALLAARWPLAARGMLGLAAFLAGLALAGPPAPPSEPGARLADCTGIATSVAWRSHNQGFVLEQDGGGRLFVRAPALPGVEEGDRVRVRGRWEHGVRGPELQAVALERLERREDGPRGWAWRALARLDEHRELAESLLLGRGNPPEKPLFRRSGLLHLLAVSGAHLAIAAALGAWLLRSAGVAWLWRQLALAGLICGYCWLTGGGPATQRALAMGLAVVAYDLLARWPHPLGPVSLAAAVLVAADPSVAADLGFQLSLLAVLGLATLGRELMAVRLRWLPLEPWPLDRPAWRVLLWGARIASDGLCLGLAATLAIVPLLAWHFPAWSPWSPLTTLVASPPTTVALWLGLPLLVLAGTWADGPWEGLYRLLEWSLDLLVATVRWAAELPGASLPAALPPWWALLLWPLLFVPGRRGWSLARLALAVILVATCLAW